MKLSSRGAPRTGLERPLCCGPLRTWRLENLVGAATAVALEVEGNVRVADLFKGLGHFRRSSVPQSTHGHNGGTCPPGEATPDGCGSTSPPTSSARVSSESPAHTSSPTTSKPKPHNAWKGKQYEAHVPTVQDRVVQAALKLVLEPVFEADFQPLSYGFRPGRRQHDAIAEIHQYATSGYEWVLEADIKACFDEIGHVPLMDRLRARIKDKRILA